VKQLIILDRDGVINHDSDAYIKSPEEWLPIPGSLEAIARLHHAGWRVVVVSNQSGVGRGLFDIETLNRIHSKMHRMVHEVGGVIDAVLFCTDSDDANPYRKPNPGMLQELARRLRIELRGVPVVGDALRDIQAAQAVGAHPCLVLTGKGRQTFEQAGNDALRGVPVFDDLATVVEHLLS